MSKEGIVNTRIEVPVPDHYDIKAFVDKENLSRVMDGVVKITVNDMYVEMIKLGIEAKKQLTNGAGDNPASNL